MMGAWVRFLLVVLGLALSGCANSAKMYESDGLLTVPEVLENANSLNGKEILVVGVVVYNTEHILFVESLNSRKGYLFLTNASISLGDKAYSKKRVVLRGVLQDRPEDTTIFPGLYLIDYVVVEIW